MTMSVPRAVRLGLGMLYLVAVALYALPANKNVTAAQITERSLTLVSQGTTGGSAPGGTVTHKFDFTTATQDDVGSIIFEYCTTAAGTCTAPTGLDVDGVTLDDETGATGFAIDAGLTNTDTIVIERTPAEVNASVALSYTFASADNPSAANESFYVRITTTDAVDGGGNTVDTGVVAASTATEIVLEGYMPESLIFCTGETISTTSGIPDCSTATAGDIDFNQAFSPADTATATSQMAASTNANFGYVITVNGATLTSGFNTISPLNGKAAGVRGLSQFGLNLVENTVATSTPAVGAEVDPGPDGIGYKGQPSDDYDDPDEFKFTTGDQVAASDNGGAGPTDSQIYTISYIVNVNGAQPVGTYTTTLSYICTATY